MRAKGVLGRFRVKARLAAQPVPVGQAEEFAQTQIRVGRDAAAARHDFADALRRHVNFLGQPVVADAQRQQKLLAQDFTGMDGGKFVAHAAPRSVVVHDFNIRGIGSLPDKAHAELIVDADAVLPGPVALERC